MDLRARLRTGLRWKWMILLVTLAAGLTAYLVSIQLPTSYATSLVALVNPRQTITGAPTDTSNTQSLPTLDQIVETYAQLVDTEPVRQRLVAAGVPRTNDQLGADISAASQPNTALINVTITDHDPAVAQLIAQDLVPAFNASLDQLQSQVGAAQSSRLQAMVPWSVPSKPPSTPVSPNIPRNVVFALFAGLAAAIALAYFFERLDNTVKTETDAVTRLGVPVMGMIQHHALATGSGLGPAVISATHAHDPASEQYRALRTNVMFSRVGQQLRSIVVTSTVPGEGKTTTACNLAVAMAQAGNRVILVDADFRRPALARVFAHQDGTGLGNLILGNREVGDVAVPSEVPDLRVIAAGPTPYNPSELLGSTAMQGILDKLTAEADFVIIDTPPVGAVTDATVLGTMADGTILVIEQGRASVTEIGRALKTLRAVSVPVLGAVLNKAKAQAGYTYYYSPLVDTGPPPPSSGGEPGSGPRRPEPPRAVADQA